MKSDSPGFKVIVQALLALENNEADLCFHYPPNKHSNLISKDVYQEEIMAVVPQGHKLAEKDLLTIDDLRHEKFILPEPGVNPGLMERFYLLTREYGFEPQIVYRAGPHQARLSLVALGEGITLDGYSVNKINISGVVYKKMHESLRTYATIAMAWRRHNPPEVLNDALSALKTK